MNAKKPFESILSLAADIERACETLEQTENLKRACAEQEARHAELVRQNEAAEARLVDARVGVSRALRRCDEECAAQRDAVSREVAERRADVVQEIAAQKVAALADVRAAGAEAQRLHDLAAARQDEIARLSAEKVQLESVVGDLRQRLAAV
jgi:hypothetical protein